MDRRNVDPVVSVTSGGEQGRSSWEGGAPKAQRAEGVLRRRRSTGRRQVRKKRPAKRVFFFWFPLRTRCFIRKWVNPTFPEQEESIYLSIYRPYSPKLYVDRRNVDPVVRGTPGRAQELSSWEGGAEGAVPAEGR